MAVRTWTRKTVVDLFPQFLTRSALGSQALADALARELGVSVQTLTVLNAGMQVETDGVITVERHRWRFPYSYQRQVPECWREAARAGLAEEVGEGWRLTTAGRDAVARLNATLRGLVARVAAPGEPVRRLLATFEDLAAKLPPDSARVAAVRRITLLSGEKPNELVRLRRAVVQLWSRRDDCHIGAWQDAGYEGPALDVLSQVWEGRASLDEVAKAVESKQRRADVERNVDALARRGDLVRDGDTLRLTAQGTASREAIEAETDRRYFAGWPVGDALAQIGDDLKTVVDALG